MKRTVIEMVILAVIVMLLQVSPVSAATSSLKGGFSLGADYDSNVDRTSDDGDEQWQTTANIFIALDTKGEKGSLSFKYAPTVKYNFRTEDNNIDHRLNVSAYNDLSKHLKFHISDNFVKTDDLWGQYLSSTATGVEDVQANVTGDTTSGNTAQSEPTLSDRIGREKFWQNNFATSIDYEYGKNSTASLGYNNRVLEYDESGNNNYKYHEPWVRVSYWFNPQWNTNFSYQYTNAEFDITQDSIAHSWGVGLNYVQSVQDTFSFGLQYLGKDYDEIVPTGRSDYYTVGANFGWTHAFSPQKTLSLTVGPTYVDRESDDSTTTTSFTVNFKNSFENGSWFIEANGGYDDRSFDAENQGLSEYQQISGGINWQLTQDLSANLGAYFRRDNYVEESPEKDENEYNGTASLRYSFGRWYFISGRYVYNQVDADVNANDYADHRFYITLGFSKELNRW